jgi:hypothetical protein
MIITPITPKNISITIIIAQKAASLNAANFLYTPATQRAILPLYLLPKNVPGLTPLL